MPSRINGIGTFRDLALQGLKVLLEPFDVGFAVVAFYQTEDGAVIEFMKYKDQ